VGTTMAVVGCIVTYLMSLFLFVCLHHRYHHVHLFLVPFCHIFLFPLVWISTFLQMLCFSFFPFLLINALLNVSSRINSQSLPSSSITVPYMHAPLLALSSVFQFLQLKYHSDCDTESATSGWRENFPRCELSIGVNLSRGIIEGCDLSERRTTHVVLIKILLLADRDADGP
jgi:hypothetical protein